MRSTSSLSTIFLLISTIYQFPRTPSGRIFQNQWLVNYLWLKYSKQENGGFGLPCVTFSRNRTFCADPGVLVSSPLINFKKALETLEKHTGKVYHKEAVATMDAFLKVMTSQQESISVQLSDAAKHS